MIRNNEPYLIEYNVRMGDPECQVILPRLKTDLAKILLNAVSNSLSKIKIKWINKKSMTIVLCSNGYPGKYKKNININNLDKIKLKNEEIIFYAGTKFMNGKLVSDGGRVLNITSIGLNFLSIRKNNFNIKKSNGKWILSKISVGG